jgi:hypothetical protein
MKRLGFTLVCSLVLAAPARGAQPTDFEMAGPAAVASTAGDYRSPVLRAPHRFDLVGMRWAGGGRPDISLRARKRGERWSKWTRVPADPDDAPDKGAAEGSPRGFSAPVWTGDADFVQYHLSRHVPRLRLHFVSIPRSTRQAMASRKAAGEPGALPAIQPRAAWGDKDCVPRSAPAYGDVQAALIHHTVSANDYTAAEVPSIILSICRYHRNSNGWNDIGYNFLVDKFGTLWEGRAGGMDQAVVGAQAQGYNSHTTGLADIGSHQDIPETSVALDAMAQLIRWKLPLHGAPTQGPVTLTSGGGSLNRYPAGTPVTMDRISGHRDGDNTACPGNALYAQLPDLRALVGNVQPQPLAQARTLLDVSLTPGEVVYPAQATVSGALRQINGEPVAGAPLELQAYGSGGWRTAWQATSGDDGGFRVDIGARLSHQIRVRFTGDPGRIGSTSKPVQLSVVPELKIQRSASQRPVGQSVTLSGTVQPNKTRLMLVVERRSGKDTARGTLKIGATSGRFTRSYKFHSPGLFRFYVAFAGDKGNAASKSGAVYVRATGGAPLANTPNGGGVSPAGGLSAR